MPADKGSNNEIFNRSGGLASDGDAARRRREKLRAEQAERERAAAEEEARREAAARAAAEETKSGKKRRQPAPKRRARMASEPRRETQNPRPERRSASVQREKAAKSDNKPGLLSKAAHGVGKFFSRAGEVIAEYRKPFAISFLSILAVAGIALSLSIFLGKKEPVLIPDEITLTEFGRTSKQTAVKSADGKMLYIYADSLFSRFGASVTGDSKSVTIVTRDGESASFTDGSDCVTVNGNTVHIRYPAIIRDYRLLLPMSFISDYVTGVDAVFAPVDGVLTIDLSEDNADGTIGFTLKAEDAAPRSPSVTRRCSASRSARLVAQ